MEQDLLFDIGTAREAFECESQQQEALAILRTRSLTKKSFELDSGKRLAPAIDMLRNGWGFVIEGTGASTDPYQLTNPKQWPQKVKTTEQLKQLYYDSEHWAAVRKQRFEFDDYRCVCCIGLSIGEIQCHHVAYNL